MLDISKGHQDWADIVRTNGGHWQHVDHGY